ncbi:MAG: PD-(D/E)XK nuclease family protein [Anaerolineales bacterium]|nr:PD-(D/E)XK nuclease family protein [Anaerolineales bacterium]MDW8226206.1 PD-(D/E)XK nuclease family protein [Anaerolineales bacterium]
MNVTSVLVPPFSFSQASLQDYLDCPRRFELRYIRQIRWPAVESEPALENEHRLEEGKRFHRLIQQYLLGIPVEKLTPLASSSNLRRWWENYLAAAPSFSGYTKHIELLLSTAVGEHRLVAQYDLIALHPSGQVLIYDWKTYTRRPRNEWMAARLQTHLYRALLVRAGAHLNGGTPIRPEQVEMIYWYAEHPAEPACFPYNADQYRRDWAALEKLVSEITTTQDFPPTENQAHCALCSYRSYCARGIRAGLAELEEESDDEPDINFEQIQEIAF